MLPQQKTPSKADAGIENIKTTLSAKWGIQLPARDSAWSPSRRDPNRVEDKIVAFIQFLYFTKPPQEGALDYALDQFDKKAVQIVSKWQFKPYGDSDVLPSLEASASALKQDFLRKRPTLSETAITELTETLKHFLNLVIDRVKAGKEFPKSGRTEGKNSQFCFQHRFADIVSDDPIPTNEVSPTKPHLSERQSKPSLWLRSKSEPEPAKGGAPSGQHPSSSDDYPDLEMADLLVDADAMNTPSAVPTQAADARNAGEPAKSEQSSSAEDTFETPPTTPPMRKNSSLGLSTDRKRSHPESMQAPTSRNVSRKTSSETSAQEVSGLISSRELN